uniref:Acyl-CoA thioesterase 7 n=1 Tax=Myotis myotis TaxID=51298 RepID=A0A7J7ZT56_MYOMY|nr:acyl-CoA thioesterase 7 [Myotis myotis]
MSGPTGETPSAIQICRIMRPDDANVAGNVHGGTILKMIEEAGVIISTRHCNSQNGERCVAVLARVERTDFLSPMCIGEVAHVSAEITYTSKHSVEVQVHVMSENILTGQNPLPVESWCCVQCLSRSVNLPSRVYTKALFIYPIVVLTASSRPTLPGAGEHSAQCGLSGLQPH